MVIRKETVKYVSYGEGLNFCPKSFSRDGIVDQMMSDNPYHVEDILPNDIVIDVGANVGGFSLLASTRTKNKIISVEPVLYDVLEENILLNKKKDQIIPLKAAFGDGNEKEITWGKTVRVNGITLSKLLKMAGGRCDFLKMDCEGGEWDGILQCDELDKIGRVAMEYHYFNKERDVELLVQKFKDSGFNVKLGEVDIRQKMCKEDALLMGMLYCTRDDWKHTQINVVK
jgi:hypothetical protein